jgi:thiol-disulfide isomerase/thioredoxin
LKIMGLHAEQRARGLVEQAASRHGNGLVLSTSFGIHSAAMLHLVTRVVPDVPVIWVDTGFRSAVCTSHDRRQKERSMSEAIHLTKLDFEDQVLSSTKPVLVDFWADWCAPCHRVAPVLDELAERYADQVAVYKRFARSPPSSS